MPLGEPYRYLAWLIVVRDVVVSFDQWNRFAQSTVLGNKSDFPPEKLRLTCSLAFSETSGTSELVTGNCTSCRVTQDKSAYWHPALYFQDASTQEYELVPQVGGMLA